MRCKDPWHKKNVLSFVDPVQYAIQCIVTSALNVICFLWRMLNHLEEQLHCNSEEENHQEGLLKCRQNPKLLIKVNKSSPNFSIKVYIFLFQSDLNWCVCVSVGERQDYTKTCCIISERLCTFYCVIITCGLNYKEKENFTSIQFDIFRRYTCN
jgi:hypothetical protein